LFHGSNLNSYYLCFTCEKYSRVEAAAAINKKKVGFMRQSDALQLSGARPDERANIWL